MAEKVKLTLSAHHDGQAPGDTVELEPSEAKRLVNGGIAVPATVGAVKKAGVDTDTAATKS